MKHLLWGCVWGLWGGVVMAGWGLDHSESVVPWSVGSVKPVLHHGVEGVVWVGAGQALLGVGNSVYGGTANVAGVGVEWGLPWSVGGWFAEGGMGVQWVGCVTPLGFSTHVISLVGVELPFGIRRRWEWGGMSVALVPMVPMAGHARFEMGSLVVHGDVMGIVTAVPTALRVKVGFKTGWGVMSIWSATYLNSFFKTMDTRFNQVGVSASF